MAAKMWRLPDEAALEALSRRLKARKVRGLASPFRPKHPAAQDSSAKGHYKADYYSRVLAHQIRQAGLPAPVFEYPFAKAQGRNWRIDLAYPSLIPPLAIEVTGHVHRIKERFQADFEREQTLFRLGWRLLRIMPKQVVSGVALQLVKEALGA